MILNQLCHLDNGFLTRLFVPKVLRIGVLVMKRLFLITICAAGLLKTSFDNNQAKAQDLGKPVAASGNARFSRILDGPNLTQKLVPFRFTGKGEIPINFVLDQSSGEQKPLKSQTMVVVYTAKGRNKRAIDQIVTIWKSPVLKTDRNEARKIPVETQIPVQKGDYVIDVIVCDTDEPIGQSKLMEYHPEPAKFPGMVINLRQYLVSVE